LSNPTSNFNWQMPTPTDLVTDLPADFEVFGQAVDSSMADLLGGTTGQILAKNSNTNMDFVWITNDQGDITGITASSPLTGGGTSGAVTIGIQDGTTAQKGAVQLENSTSSTSTTTAAVPASVKSAYDLADGAIAKTTVTTAGDIIFRNATVPTRLGIGTANQVLRVNSGATAPEWATVSSGALTKITSASFSAVTDTGTTFDGIFSSTYANYIVVFKGYSGTDNVQFQVQTRVGSTTQTGVDYYGGRWWVGYNGSTAAAGTSGQTKWQPAELRTTANNDTLINMNFSNVGTGSNVKPMFNSTAGGGWLAGTYLAGGAIATASYNATGLIFSASSGTITGTIYVYGVQN
jgi:hypothetical protein